MFRACLVLSMATTLTPVECESSAEPDYSVACLQITGDSATTCMPSRGRADAQVLYSPYIPGASYTATGRGCGRWVGQPPAQLCRHLGPNSATL